MPDSLKIAVFVPADISGPIAAFVAPGSAIVGPAEGSEADQVTVYYEGNLYGAANVQTYADHARQAAGRLSARYPTIARAVVPRRELRQVGWFDPANGVTLLDEAQGKEALASWLGVAVIEESELRFSD